MRTDDAVPATGRARRGLARRVVLVLVGSTISTVAYAVTIRAGLGLGPLFVLQDGFARSTGISIGASVTATGFMFVALSLSLRWWPGPGTLALPVLGGVTLDAVLPHVPALPGWPLRTVAVVLATWLMALGGALVIRGRVGVAAYDAVMLGLHRILRRRRLAVIRLGREVSVLAVGYALGGAVGVGTVVTGGLIGPALQFWLRVVGGLGPAPDPAPDPAPEPLPSPVSSPAAAGG